MDVIWLILLLYILLFKLFQLCPVEFCRLPSVPFDMYPPFFSLASLFCDPPQDCPRASHMFTAAALDSTNFPKSLCSFYWGIAFRNQALGAPCDHCYWGPLLLVPLGG